MVRRQRRKKLEGKPYSATTKGTTVSLVTDAAEYGCVDSVEIGQQLEALSQEDGNYIESIQCKVNLQIESANSRFAMNFYIVESKGALAQVQNDVSGTTVIVAEKVLADFCGQATDWSHQRLRAPITSGFEHKISGSVYAKNVTLDLTPFCKKWIGSKEDYEGTSDELHLVLISNQEQSSTVTVYPTFLFDWTERPGLVGLKATKAKPASGLQKVPVLV